MPDPLPPCPYTILGVAKDAQVPDIRTAYRKLVLKCHPDKVTDPKLKEQKADEFQKVQRAYELLSNDDQRTQYDDQIKLAELRKAKAYAESNTSVPRTPPTARFYEVRTAEPRPDLFKSKSSSRAPSATGSKMYSPYPPSRSYEDEIYNSSRHHYDDVPRARRATSYDEKPSKREEERERESRRRRKEVQEETNRLAVLAEKAARKQEKERAMKSKRADKEKQDRARRRDVEEKRTHRQAYVEPFDDDPEPVRISKSDKKKSSSGRKHDDRDKRDRERSVPREQDALDAALKYMESARSKAAHTQAPTPSLSRSHTFADQYSHRYAPPPAAVPTPPTAQDAPFPPPSPPPPGISVSVEEEDEDEDEDEVVDIPRRSSAKSSTRRTIDQSTHKKSASGPRDAPAAGPSPVIIDSPTPRTASQFAKAGTTPPTVPDSPPRSAKLPRSQTMRDTETRTPPSQPSISRAQTYHYAGEPDPRVAEPRGRGRSRMQPQPQVLSEESESEDEKALFEEWKRSRRQKARSPQAEYPPPPRSSTVRYNINGGRAVPTENIAYSYRDESPPRSKSKGAYYSPSHVRTADYADYANYRPPMPARDSSTYSSSGRYFAKVRTTKSYTPDDIQYGHREEAYGRA